MYDSDDSEFDEINLTNGCEFQSFSDYIDEPIYSEPDLRFDMKIGKDKNRQKHSDQLDFHIYDLLTVKQGRYHCKPPETDSDYASYDQEKGENDNCTGGFLFKYI